jgi:ABC-2 type transport system ATP-binding protein
MQKGELIREGTVKELTSQRGVFLVAVAEKDFPEAELRAKGISARAIGERWELSLPDGVEIDVVLDLFRERGLRLRHLVEKRMTLEDIFVSMVEAAEPGVDARRRKRQADRDDYDRGRESRGRDREYDDDRRGRREDYR